MWFCDVIQILNLYDKLSLLRPDKSVRDYLPRPFAVVRITLTGRRSPEDSAVVLVCRKFIGSLRTDNNKAVRESSGSSPSEILWRRCTRKNTLRKPEAHAETDGAKYAVTALAVIAGLFTGRELNG